MMLFKQRSSSLPFYILLVSLVIGYMPYWAPFYINIFKQEQMTLLGHMNQFEVPCVSPAEDGRICRKQYNIPVSMFPQRGAEFSLGVGHIIQSVRYGCFDGGKYTYVSSGDGASGVHGRMSELHRYQIVRDAVVPCKEFVAVQAWSKVTDQQVGYVGGTAAFGKTYVVEQVKRFVEFFLVYMYQMTAIFTLVLYCTVRRFMAGLVTQTSSTTYFYELAPLWMASAFFSSNILSVLIPIDLNTFEVNRIGNCVSLLTIFNTARAVLVRQAPTSLFAKVYRVLGEPIFARKSGSVLRHLLSPIMFAFVIGAFTLNNWMVFFAKIQLINSVALLIASRYDSAVPACFAISVIGSVLKLMGFTYAPQSNTAFFFVLFYLGVEVFLVVSTEIRSHLFDLIDRSTADSKLAQQLAHDIRSPLSALRMLMGQVPWGESQTEVKNAAVMALDKMRLISRDALTHRKRTAVATSEIGVIEEVSILKRSTQSKPISINWNGVCRTSLVPLLPENLFRLIDNLVSNAIEEEESDAVLIEVRDGIGKVTINCKNRSKSIDPSVLRNITINGGTFGKNEGHGLGLKFCREQVEAVGGALEVMCEQGHFSVTIQLPYVPANSDAGPRIC